MSELDLGATSTPATAATSAPVAGGLVLDPPKPVPLVKEEQVASAPCPLDDTKKSELASARRGVRQRARGDGHRTHRSSPRRSTRSPRWVTRNCAPRRTSRTGCSIGPPRWSRPAKGGGGGDAQTRVATHARRPAHHGHRSGPEPGRSVRRQEGAQVAAGRRQDRSATSQKYESAQTHLNAIIKSLDVRSGRPAQGQRLHRDREGEHVDDDGQAERVQRSSPTALDDAVSQKVAELEAAGQHRGRERRSSPTRCSRSGSGGRTS